MTEDDDRKTLRNIARHLRRKWRSVPLEKRVTLTMAAFDVFDEVLDNRNHKNDDREIVVTPVNKDNTDDPT